MSPNFIPIIIFLSVFLTAYTWWLVSVYLDSPCSDATLAQYSRLSRHCTSLAHQEKYHSSYLDSKISHFWAPTWSCPLAEDIGHTTDAIGGSKWVCDVDHIDSDCVVYSFGTTTNYTFEMEMNSRFDCEVHIFDPFVLPSGTAENIHHHTWNSKSHKIEKIADTVLKLGHAGQDIDVISFNVHGCELAILDNPLFLSELNKIATRIDQIIVTVITSPETDYRYCDSPPKVALKAVQELFQFFSRNGYAVFHREHKHEFAYYHGDEWGTPGDARHVEHPTAGSVTEFSFVRLNYNCDSKIFTSNSKYVSF